MKLLTLACVMVSFASLALSQGVYRVSGVIRNKEFSVVPGFFLSVEKDGKE